MPGFHSDHQIIHLDVLGFDYRTDMQEGTNGEYLITVTIPHERYAKMIYDRLIDESLVRFTMQFDGDEYRIVGSCTRHDDPIGIIGIVESGFENFEFMDGIETDDDLFDEETVERRFI